MKDSNIFALATISLIVNLVLLIGSGAYIASLGWQNTFDAIETDINTILGTELNIFNNIIPDSGVCRPDDTTCQHRMIRGKEDTTIFDVFASVFSLAFYAGVASSFIKLVMFAPYILANMIAPLIKNVIILSLMSLMGFLWNMAIIIKVIAFILNKRGMK